MILLSFLRFQCIYKYNNINKYLYEYLKIEKKKIQQKTLYFNSYKWILSKFEIHFQVLPCTFTIKTSLFYFDRWYLILWYQSTLFLTFKKEKKNKLK